MHEADEARLALTTELDWDERTAALLDGVGPLNIFRVIANHPDLLRRWLVFGAHVIGKSTLPAREREIAILRTGWRCGSEYEFGQHTLLGAAVGLTEDEIWRITGDADDPAWSPRDRTLLVAVDQLVECHDLDDATWAALVGDWSTEQVLDLVFAVGQYVLVSTFLRAARVPLDEGVPGFPS